MFASTFMRRNAGLFVVCGALSQGLLISGCADDATIAPLVVTPQTALADATSDTADTEPQPELIATPAATPTTPSPATPTFQDLVDEPVDVFQPSSNAATPVFTQASDNFLALQRLFPATSLTYTVPRDGSTFNEVINFSSGTLEEEGEDSQIIMSYTDSSNEFCIYTDLIGYFCFRLFENGLGLLKMFSLEANNTGSGAFHACDAIALDVDGCVTELFTTPSGSLAAVAGLPAASGPVISSLIDNGSYIQYLGENDPEQTSRTGSVPIESVEAVQYLVNRSISQ